MHPELPGTTIRWATAADFPQPGGRGPNGRRMCRWCHQEVPRGKRAWCGEGCVEQYLIRCHGHTVRRLVLERDRGICAFCGMDAEKLFRVIRLAQHHGRDFGLRLSGWAGLLDQLGRFNSFGETFWQPDHIVPVSGGGGQCGLSNYRTLCTPCHLVETGRLRTRLYRKEQEATPGGLVEQAQLEMDL